MLLSAGDLAFQTAQARFDFTDDILNPLQIVPGVIQTTQSFLTAGAVRSNARSLLE
ncbi:MAG: hypothetical protein BWY63_01322 [Chloroflexi bacterium ADurb.Bin360]|nr:MAG: hypothetical protein BWY63_01322 [Chloroflexi bacterium ADurb.Bin360]